MHGDCRVWARRLSAKALERSENMPTAQEAFSGTISRSMKLMVLAQELYEGESEATDPFGDRRIIHQDMARAGIVLSVAAMDAYFTKKYSELFVPFLKAKGATPDLVRMLEAAGLDVEQALEMIAMERPYRRIRTLIDCHLERKATQRFEAIDDLFKSYGLSKLCENAQKKTGRKRLLRSIEILVERRHAIVHEGDLDKYGRLSSIDFKSMRSRVASLLVFVMAADGILEAFAQKLNRKTTF
jgi:hypothetical protein